MIRQTLARCATAPTPMAGLALGIGSLGWCWENTSLFHATSLQGQAQAVGAAIASVLLLILTTKFILNPKHLRDDLAHPVVGSVVPTFAMATMVVSKAIGGTAGSALWIFAVGLHLLFLITFVWHRSRQFELQHMLPSWFVPPVGIIVAAVANPGGALTPIAQGLFWFGLISYGLMLPVMLYRLIFAEEVPDAAKPTIAILAAPASLSLAGYLTVVAAPSPLLVDLLLGVAVLMTMVIYLAFIKLLRLPFSPGYAAFTFPMVIGATALYKVADMFTQWGVTGHAAGQLQLLAELELLVATLLVGYVALRYLLFFNPLRRAKLAL